MAQKYIQVSSIDKAGKAFISLKGISEIATCVLEDLPNVSFLTKEKVSSQTGINILIDKPIMVREEKGKLKVYIHVLARKGENASSLAGVIQKEVGEQIESETELSNCSVNMKIDGIF